MKNILLSYSLASVFQNQALGADHPNPFFRGGKSVEIRSGAALLTDPVFPPVTRSQDRSVPADDPSIFIVREGDAEEILRRLDRHPLPGQARVRRSENRPLRADYPAAFFVDEFYVNQFFPRAALLPPPGLPAVFGVQDPAGVADNPTLLLVRKGYAVKRRHVVFFRPWRHG